MLYYVKAIEKVILSLNQRAKAQLGGEGCQSCNCVVCRLAAVSSGQCIQKVIARDGAVFSRSFGWDLGAYPTQASVPRQFLVFVPLPKWHNLLGWHKAVLLSSIQ